MRTQPPKERIKNFNEVALGLTEEEAVKEAKRCLNCKKALCVEGCPVEIDIPNFINFIGKGEFEKAILKIREKNALPAVCGRVCPQEDQCEKACILAKPFDTSTGSVSSRAKSRDDKSSGLCPEQSRGTKKREGISIGDLERFAADWEINNVREFASSRVREFTGSRVREFKHTNKKAAVIGSGPAGITCAGELAKMGYSVTVFESLHKPGGVLTYGIPEFRLPKNIVASDIDYVKSLGVNIELNFLVGKTKTVGELKKEGYRAFFVGIGAGLPYFLGVEGEHLNGIYSANEFLTRTNLMKSYLFPEYDTPVRVGERAAVIGAGNVAMDSARSALRLGAQEVYIIYRRTENEMPARIDEIHRAKEEGIRFELLTHPVKFFGDDNGWVKEAEILRNRLGEPDSSGRRKPVPIKGSEFRMRMDTVICAIGQGPNPLMPKTLPDLKLNEDGNIVVDKNGMTSIEGIFAGGDIVTGADTVISAMGAGKLAARSIDRYLRR